MEVLEIAGYTEEEKLKIARDHLVGQAGQQPRPRRGLAPLHADAALAAIIRGYTREAGVRNLEREIGAICRKAARRAPKAPSRPASTSPRKSSRRCSARRDALDEEMKDRTKDPGVAIGLAWTPVGGEVLFIEASRMAGERAAHAHRPSRRRHEGVGAHRAVVGARARARLRHRPRLLQETRRCTCTCPSGAIPKDGPSAGVTMATAMASALTGRPVRGDIAMTGEITLSGRVLPVGGIKEKVLAARRLGIREVILPRQNQKNVNEDLTPELRRGLTVHYVDDVDEVLAIALTPAVATSAAAAQAIAARAEEKARQRLTLA